MHSQAPVEILDGILPFSGRMGKQSKSTASRRKRQGIVVVAGSTEVVQFVGKRGENSLVAKAHFAASTLRDNRAEQEDVPKLAEWLRQ